MEQDWCSGQSARLPPIGSLRIDDGAVRLRDMLTAHAFLSTCQLRAKVDGVGESDLPASWKRKDVMLVFKIFLSLLRVFCQIIWGSQAEFRI